MKIEEDLVGERKGKQEWKEMREGNRDRYDQKTLYTCMKMS